MKISKVVLLLVLFASGVFAQSTPTASQWQWIAGNLFNKLPTQNASSIFLSVKQGTEKDSLILKTLGSFAYLAPEYGNWYLGNNGSHFKRAYIDTVQTSGLNLAGQYYSTLLGQGLTNSSGQLQVTLTNLVSASDIINQTLSKSDFDTTLNYPFGGAFHITTAVADSAYKSKRYIDSSIAGLPVVGGTAPSANQIPKWNGSAWAFTADAGGTTNDNVKMDSTAGAGGVWDVTDPVFKAGSGITLGKSGADTVLITATGGGAIELDGDTTSATSTFNWSNSKFDSLQYIDVDSIHLDSKGASVVLADSVKLNGFGMTAYNSNDMYVTGASGKNVFVGQTSTGTNGALFLGDNTNSTGYQVKGDTLMQGYGSSSVAKMILKGVKYARIDSLRMAQFTTRPFLGDSTKSDSGLTTVKNVRDTLNSYLTTNLANYVRKTAENWQDLGTSNNSWALPSDQVGPVYDTALTINRTLNNSDTTYMAPKSGSLMLTAPVSVVLQGTGANEFQSNIRVDGFQVDSVGLLDADTLNADYGVRLNASPTGAQTGYVILKSAGSIAVATPWLIPSNASGVLNNDGNGNLSWGAGGGSGGGGFKQWFNTVTTPNLADSLQWIGGSGITLTFNNTPDPGTVTVAASGLQPSNFLTHDSIATQKNIKDSILLIQPWANSSRVSTYVGSDSLALKNALGTLGFAVTFTHTTVDTVRLKPMNGFGIAVGDSMGNTRIGTGYNVASVNHDTIFFTDSVIVFGKVGTSPKLTPKLIDSMIQQKGVYATGGGGTGDITDVGSVTSSAAFNSVSTAHTKWLGLGSAAGRIQFDTGLVSADNNDDAVYVPKGRLGVGPNLPGFDFDIKRDTTATITSEIFNTNAGAAANARQLIQTAGGDPFTLYGDGSANYSVGVDQSDSHKWKVSNATSLGSSDMITINGTTSVLLGGAPRKGADVADSTVRTIGGKRLWQQAASIGDAIYYYPAATGTNDTACHMGQPRFYKDGDSTVLFYDTVTTAGFALKPQAMVLWSIQDSAWVDTLVLTLRTNAATVTNAKMDSVRFTSTAPGSMTQTYVASYTTAFNSASTGLTTRLAIPFGAVGATVIPNGSVLQARFFFNFASVLSSATVYNATLKGNRR